MASEADEVIFECPLLKLRGTRKRSIKFGGSNSWQQKYFMLKRHGDVPYLVYYNKKPRNNNAIPRGRISLLPTFRVEKSMNAKNRAYVFEVTTKDRQLCLSADEQKVMDLFVFFLQIQFKLSDNIIDDYFIVQPENSEAFRRIGARGTCCMFHIAPWGVTLALKDSRVVLAQWPLKCIRCYESNSNGQFILEAGRIAPMGDGVYVFNTKPNEDNAMYDLLDKYVLNATAALQGRHPNNQEQYSDLLLERDRLNALTNISSNLCLTSELFQATVVNYNFQRQGQPESIPTSHVANQSGGTPQNYDGYITPQSPSQDSPIPGEGRPRPIALTNEMFGVVANPDHNRNTQTSKTVSRPTPMRKAESQVTPLRPSIAKNHHSMGSFVDLESPDGYLDMSQSVESLTGIKSVTNPPMSPGHDNWFPPPTFSEATRVSAGSYAGLGASPPGSHSAGVPSPEGKASLNGVPRVLHSHSKSHVGTPGTPPISSGLVHIGPVLPAEDLSYLNPKSSEQSTLNKPPVAPRNKNKGHDSPSLTPKPKYRMLRLKSRSCEDMSEFDKSVYANTDIDPNGFTAIDDDGKSNGKTTPEPFAQLDTFENRRCSTDRPVRRFVKHEKSASGVYDSSTISHTRHNHKQQYLRRSVSNPNFFDLESKDIVTKREKLYKPMYQNGTNLEKSNGRSLASLLPGALRRHLSRENNSPGNDHLNDSLIDGDNSPSRSDRFRQRSSSMTKSSPDIPSSNFTRHFRRSSFGSKDSVTASTKGIRMSEKSRSFRKQKTSNESEDSVLNTGSVSLSGTDSNPGTPAVQRQISPPTFNRTTFPQSPPLDYNSLPVRRRHPNNIMAGRRLPSLPDPNQRESGC